MTPSLIVVTIDTGIVRPEPRQVYVNANLIRYLYPADRGCMIYFDDADKLHVTQSTTEVANLMLGKAP